MKDYEAKLALFAKMLEGQVVHDEQRVQICVKGFVIGFPAKLEAIRASYPFGVSYFIETRVDPSAPPSENPMRLVIMPRYIRGFFSFISRLLLIESTAQKLGEPRFDSAFSTSCDVLDQGKRFAHYPGVVEKLLQLEKYTKFTELLIRTDAGLYLSQPTSFAKLDLDVCRETFRILGELGQIVFDAFS